MSFQSKGMQQSDKAGIFSSLQTDILRLQGFKPANSAAVDLGLGAIKHIFPNSSFPTGCVHEFLTGCHEDAAATNGFLTGLLSSLLGDSGIALWISTSRTLFPPALERFGVQPDRFVFVDVKKEKEILWAIDEAMKCSAVSAVVGEIPEISFTDSRRLQLATEQSQVTGFLLRTKIKQLNTTACVSRWKITSLPSDQIDDLPGVGFPKWKVDLLKIRNGRTGSWEMKWINGRFNIGVDHQGLRVVRDLETDVASSTHQKKAG